MQIDKYLERISGPGLARPAEERGSPGLPSPRSRTRPAGGLAK